MAKAVFHKGQRVYVKPVATWAVIEQVHPQWVKGVEEPLRVTYDTGLGRDFQAHELAAEEKDPHDASKTVHVFKGFEPITKGTLTPAEYNLAVADLVAFLHWMGEPNQGDRVRLGVWVLIFLAIFTVIAWRLNAAFWKDVK